MLQGLIWRKFGQIEGLAKHLRCVGIDAATPSSRKPEPRSSLEVLQKML